MTRTALAALALALALLLDGCGPPVVPIPPEQLPLDRAREFTLALDRERGYLAILDADGGAVINSFGRRPLVEAGRGRGITQDDGSLRDDVLWRTDRARITDVERTGDREIRLSWTLAGDGREIPCEIRVRKEDEGRVRLLVRPLPGTAGTVNRIWLHLASDPHEAMLGLGQQSARSNHQGRRVPVLVTPETPFPIPFYLSNRGHGLLLRTEGYSVFDFRSPYRTGIEVWRANADVELITGDHPLTIIERLTAQAGRMPALPSWIFDTWLTVNGGPDRIREEVSWARGAGAPVGAVWTPDWPGVPDPGRDGAMGTLIRELGEQGVCLVGTVSPALSPGDRLYSAANERGYLLHPTGDGDTAALLNLDNAEAREWYLRRLRAALLQAGAAGWMAEIGPPFPYENDPEEAADAVALRHGRAVRWALLNRRALGDAGRPGQHLFLSSSGFLGSGRVVMLHAIRNQTVGWGLDGGMASAIPAMTSAGISGIPFTHGGVGGSVGAASAGRSGREVFLRWAELGAYSLVFRIEDGSPQGGSWSFHADPGTLAHFAEMARQHRRLRPYLGQLVKEAARTGRPVIRHPYLVFPDDPVSVGIEDQYFLGDNILVAPVLKDNVLGRSLYLPEGRWYNLNTGRSYRGPGRRALGAPLGEPLVFRREGWNLPE